MKFLVISDTHGKIEKALEIYKNIPDIDTIIHLGDYEKDAEALAEILGCDVISVKGNMDGGYSKKEFKIIDTECGKLLLTHGHMQNVKGSLQSLLYFAEENACDTVLFGHTHRAVNEDVYGIKVINPGSLTLPADGTKGTYAIIEIAEGTLVSKIHEWEGNPEDASSDSPAPKKNNESAKKKSKVQGGFIYDLLNNSDRF